MSDLNTHQIVLRYGSDVPPVLAGLTLNLQACALVGVVGPNGAGKSTLVRALARTLLPSQGVVTLSGHDLYRDLSARDSAREIAVVPQDTSVAFDFSVREVVEMGRAPHLPRRPFAAPGPKDEALITAALQQAGVVDFAARPISTLSGGERQRVLLARALAQDTSVLLLDEPTAHLDLHHQAQTLMLARDLAQMQGRAVLAVLHDLNLAAAYCDQLVLLAQGGIVAQGTPAEVLTAERIRAVYGARVWVRRNPITNRPYLLSLPERHAILPSGQTILLLCGNETGAEWMETLTQSGFLVICGPLNAGDTDAEAADALGIPFLREAPFSPLSDATIAETQRLALEANIVVLAPVSFGPSNVALLQVALEVCQAGKPTFCVQSPETAFADRDFTHGLASRLWEQLLAAGATIVSDAQAVPVMIKTGTE